MTIDFIIHDINKTGGQERSTLEIIKNLIVNNKIRVLASSHADLPEGVIKIGVPVIFRRPLILKDFFFRIFVEFLVSRSKTKLTHATGTCAFFSDIFTIQFIQKRWKQEIHKVQYVSYLTGLKEKIQVFHDSVWESLIFFLNRHRRFIAISEQVGQDLKNLYGLKDVVIIPHGVNSTDFSPDPTAAKKFLALQYPNLGSAAIFIFVGAFERKGLRTLLQALSKVDKIRRDWKLIVVGAGPFAEMKKLSQTLGVLEKIIFVGSQKNVIPFYQAADLFILPSHYDPFGLVGAEALACGCPSILSKSSGCSELITEGKNGFVLNDSRDDETLSQLILKFMENPQDVELMRKNARQSVEQHSWPEVALKYEKAFKEVSQLP